MLPLPGGPCQAQMKGPLIRAAPAIKQQLSNDGLHYSLLEESSQPCKVVRSIQAIDTPGSGTIAVDSE